MYSRLKKDDDLLVVKERGTESFIFDPYNPLNKEITVEISIE